MRDDFTKLQQAHDGVIARLAEAEDARFLAGVEQAGGDVNAAKQLVERAKAVRVQEALNIQLASRLAQTKAELDAAGLGKTVTDLIKQYELPAEAAAELQTAQTKPEMEVIAANLALKRVRAAAVPAKKVGGEGGAGKGGADLSKLSPMEQLKIALKH